MISLNRSLIESQFNVLDRTKLESALAAPLRTWGGEYLEESPLKRAAMLIEHLTNAHAFIDGNKRTAWICGVVYLEECGFLLQHIEDEEVSDFMVEVALNRMSIEEIGLWLAGRLS
ncbi:Fic family protein [Corynebacterium striatum]|nr:Fic family protein [Corynebacterium striatum]MDK8806796.1 Fic family protein [Corynebacterium striatum]MDK8844676.1 Fic family protein [Corynebacterium striatum]HAT1504287.1 Fic family protein [Corynebacterium striatum]HAT1506847.1 Fic family protein [Corynebacterium striatum]HCD1917616.1 Fic family protein [Corynebacterium striatum]